MAVDWSNLDREKFRAMSSRETVQNVPKRRGTTSLTKKQVATLVLIYADEGGYGQIRRYPSNPSRGRRSMPSPSVPETLEKKGFVRISNKSNPMRGRSGNMTRRKEGGNVSAYHNDDMLDALAQKLGFKNRFSDGLARFMRQQMEQM